MAYITIIDDEHATPEIKQLYDKYRAPWGGVDHILKIHSLMPHTLTPHVDLYRTIMFGKGPLTRREREMIATVVSKANDCRYCTQHHSDGLLRVTKDKELAATMRENFRDHQLSDAERAMLEFAEQLTTSPEADHASSVQKLKSLAFTEEAILHITLVIAYFNFVNRIANGLGVHLEDYWREDGFSDPDLPMAHDHHD